MIPPNPLKDYVARYGEEETARRLTQVLGKPIRPAIVRINANVTTRRPPVTWLAALGLDTSKGGSSQTPPARPVRGMPRQPLPPESIASLPGEEPNEEEPPRADGATAAGGPSRSTEHDPTPPDDADWKIPTQTGAGLVQAAAKERIAALHVFAGSAIATAADADGFENDRGVGGGIAKLWADRSNDIAEAWISWAEEGNRFAASFVKLMASGGAGGSLALGYAALLGGTAYIMGTMPDNEATKVLYGRYTRYRTVTADEAVGQPDPADERARAAASNGSPVDGSDDHVGSPSVSAG